MPKDDAFTAQHPPSLEPTGRTRIKCPGIPQKLGGHRWGKTARTRRPQEPPGSLVPIEASGTETGNSPPNQPRIPARKARGRRGDHRRPPPRILRAPARPRFQRRGGWQDVGNLGRAICTNAGSQFGEGEAGGRNK